MSKSGAVGTPPDWQPPPRSLPRVETVKRAPNEATLTLPAGSVATATSV